MKYLKLFEDSRKDYSINDWEITDYDTDSGVIKSVKRTEDGEIFSVGDLIGLKGFNVRKVGKIDRIWKSHKQMRLDIGNFGLPLSDMIVKM